MIAAHACNTGIYIESPNGKEQDFWLEDADDVHNYLIKNSSEYRDYLKKGSKIKIVFSGCNAANDDMRGGCSMVK